MQIMTLQIFQTLTIRYKNMKTVIISDYESQQSSGRERPTRDRRVDYARDCLRQPYGDSLHDRREGGGNDKERLGIRLKYRKLLFTGFCWTLSETHLNF